MAFSMRSAISSLKPILLARVSSPKTLSVKVMTNHFSTSNEDPHKSVFISQSSDVFSNLALEDWLYRNFDFKNHHVMLLWRNDPCVVIGRHQNPWMEANIEALADRGITLARRNSGGGTVYHDKGNLNITFFTPRELYNRKKNLQLIEKTIEREWNLDIEINKREDLILDSKYKVSGTAAKLGRPTAYHHCTLMVHVNKDDLALSLKKSDTEKFTTKALESIGSSIQNLGDAHNEVQMERLMERLGWEFMRTNVNLADEGWLHVSKQNGFQMINPTDEWFPGSFAKHYETGEPIPEVMLKALCSSKHLLSASETQLQLFYSMLDQEFHAVYPLKGSTTDVLADVQNRYYSLPHVKGTAWHLRFSHLVGYGAKYYSYLMSRAIASLIWQRCFAEAPLDRNSGEAYRHQVLAHGGSKPVRNLLNDFLKFKVTPLALGEALAQDMDSKYNLVKS